MDVLRARVLSNVCDVVIVEDDEFVAEADVEFVGVAELLSVALKESVVDGEVSFVAVDE